VKNHVASFSNSVQLEISSLILFHCAAPRHWIACLNKQFCVVSIRMQYLIFRSCYISVWSNYKAATCCHITILSFKEFGLILLSTVNVSLVSKARYHSTAQNFVAKLVRLTLQLYFNMMSGICYTNLFVCGRSVTLWIWQSFLFRQSIAVLTLWSLS